MGREAVVRRVCWRRRKPLRGGDEEGFSPYEGRQEQERGKAARREGLFPVCGEARPPRTAESSLLIGFPRMRRGKTQGNPTKEARLFPYAEGAGFPHMLGAVYTLFRRLCHSMWLFHLHSRVKI